MLGTDDTRGVLMELNAALGLIKSFFSVHENEFYAFKNFDAERNDKFDNFYQVTFFVHEKDPTRKDTKKDRNRFDYLQSCLSPIIGALNNYDLVATYALEKNYNSGPTFIVYFYATESNDTYAVADRPKEAPFLVTLAGALERLKSEISIYQNDFLRFSFDQAVNLGETIPGYNKYQVSARLVSNTIDETKIDFTLGDGASIAQGVVNLTAKHVGRLDFVTKSEPIKDRFNYSVNIVFQVVKEKTELRREYYLLDYSREDMDKEIYLPSKNETVLDDYSLRLWDFFASIVYYDKKGAALASYMDIRDEDGKHVDNTLVELFEFGNVEKDAVLVRKFYNKFHPRFVGSGLHRKFTPGGVWIDSIEDEDDREEAREDAADGNHLVI